MQRSKKPHALLVCEATARPGAAVRPNNSPCAVDRLSVYVVVSPLAGCGRSGGSPPQNGIRTRHARSPELLPHLFDGREHRHNFAVLHLANRGRGRRKRPPNQHGDLRTGGPLEFMRSMARQPAIPPHNGAVPKMVGRSVQKHPIDPLRPRSGVRGSHRRQRVLPSPLPQSGLEGLVAQLGVEVPKVTEGTSSVCRVGSGRAQQ